MNFGWKIRGSDHAKNFFIFEAWNYLKLFEYVIVISSWDTSFRVCLKFNRLLNMAELSFQYVYRLLTTLSPVYFGLCNNKPWSLGFE